MVDPDDPERLRRQAAPGDQFSRIVGRDDLIGFRMQDHGILRCDDFRISPTLPGRGDQDNGHHSGRDRQGDGSASAGADHHVRPFSFERLPGAVDRLGEVLVGKVWVDDLMADRF